RSGFSRSDRLGEAIHWHPHPRQPCNISRRVPAMNRGTLTQLFFTTIDRHAGLPAAFRSKVGGAWISITHREALERVQALSLGLRELAEIEAKGRAAQAKYPDWKHEALSVAPEDLATLIYTSGTTGDPKGVMLSHYNIWSNVQACLQMIPIGSGDECLSMLPLSHSYERMVDYTLFQAGVIINYAESFDTVAGNLQEVKPTVVLSVPRLYEKVYARVLENALSGSAIKRSIFFWAKRAGEQWAALSLAGLPIPGGMAS